MTVANLLIFSLTNLVVDKKEEKLQTFGFYFCTILFQDFIIVMLMEN